MAHHAKDDIRDEIYDDVYGSVDISRPMPKYRMPDDERDPRLAFSVVHDELMLDGNARQNLASDAEFDPNQARLSHVQLPETPTAALEESNRWVHH